MVKKSYFGGKVVVLVSFVKNENPSEKPIESFLRIGVKMDEERMEVPPELRSRKMLIGPRWGGDLEDMACSELLRRVVPDAKLFRWKTHCFSINNEKDLETETIILLFEEFINELKERRDLEIDIDQLERRTEELLP